MSLPFLSLTDVMLKPPSKEGNILLILRSPIEFMSPDEILYESEFLARTF